MMALFGAGRRASRHWMVCDVTDRRETPCLFDEEAALRRGDPPRCIRHGALLFSDTTLTGMAREDARKRLNEDE
jgi:hypothetical protein